MMLRADLHIHSTFSDGSKTPFEIAEEAHERGVELISITDHDSLSGHDIKKAAAEKFNLKYINGIEISAYESTETHMLGYNYDVNNQEFIEKIAQTTKMRDMRNLEILKRLEKYYGIEITENDIVKTEGFYGSMHIAKALIKKNYAQTIKEAFDKYIGINAKAYVDIHRTSPFEAIGIINAAGGITSLAHPYKLKRSGIDFEKLLKTFVDCGLKGIECVYFAHTTSETDYFKSLAEKYKLKVTGGSDFHGEGRAETIGYPEFFFEA